MRLRGNCDKVKHTTYLRCASIAALDAGNGTIRWHHPTGGQIFGRLAVANGIVYGGSSDHYFYALVYITSADANLYALNASNGQFAWKRGGFGTNRDWPTTTQGIVYDGSSDGNVYALNGNNGTILWKHSTGQPRGSPGVGQ